MWTALKSRPTTTAAAAWLKSEHKFEIANPTLLRYLRDGKLDAFASSKDEVEAVRNDIAARSGGGWRRGKEGGQSPKRPASTTPVELRDAAKDDLAEIGKFYDAQFSLLSKEFRFLPGCCKFLGEDPATGKNVSCSCHTIAQLFGGVSKVPPEFRFGTHTLNHCLKHTYVSLQTSGKIRVMNAVSSLALSNAA